ncbi:quinolinate synthase NadA [Haloechinothrix salitolerans]
MRIECALPEQHPECVRSHVQYRAQNLVCQGGSGVNMAVHVFDPKAKTEADATQGVVMTETLTDTAPDLTPYGGVDADAAWADEVRRLARQRDAVLLAHNYQLPEIQEIADHTGDSLALSRIAAESEASTIVFCGVHFMAETAKILSPDKTVLIPDARAGCSLADSLTAEQLREWKAQHPGAVVVSYVNTTADVKAETDICCTSSNAVDVVASIPADQDVLFAPDQFLGAHVKRETGRENLHIWAGECHVHAGINGPELAERAAANPDADLFIHPECGCATSALYLAGEGTVPADKVKILSTGDMVKQARDTSAKSVLVATEVGMLHQLRKAAPEIDFAAVNDRASCRYMKMITPAALLRSLRDGVDEVHVDAETARRARASVERMIAIGQPGGGE